jgi:hypothetical protein
MRNERIPYDDYIARQAKDSRALVTVIFAAIIISLPIITDWLVDRQFKQEITIANAGER